MILIFNIVYIYTNLDFHLFVSKSYTNNMLGIVKYEIS